MRNTWVPELGVYVSLCMFGSVRPWNTREFFKQLASGALEMWEALTCDSAFFQSNKLGVCYDQNLDPSTDDDDLFRRFISCQTYCQLPIQVLCWISWLTKRPQPNNTHTTISIRRVCFHLLANICTIIEFKLAFKLQWWNHRPTCRLPHWPQNRNWTCKTCYCCKVANMPGPQMKTMINHRVCLFES